MPHTVRHSQNPWWMTALVCCCFLELSGCSLFVMAGKMLQGDPMVESEFDRWYGKSMLKSKKKVAVVCSTPESVKSEFTSLDLDLASEVSRKLHLHEITVVKSHKVASWMDDHGGTDFDMKELGNDLGAELVVAIKVDHFDFREENSPDLFRGKARGVVTVYELMRDPKKPKKEAKSEAESKKDKSESADKSDEKTGSSSKSKKTKKDDEPKDNVIGVRQVFLKTFDTTYPPHQPVSIEQMQPETFRKKFLDRVGDELARQFYRHKAGVEF
ncbi:MAG: hypothetical protein JWN70_2474 [Planctomycetaceae bacterium]|nr:hypothetical protein [Planctomycetaceae bacterium]